MSTISGTITTGVTFGGSYTSPLTITGTGAVSDNAGPAVYAAAAYANPVLLNGGTIITSGGYVGVRFMGGGRVDNSGLIGGNSGSVYIYGATGTVTNSGTIAGTGNDSISLLDAAVVLCTGGTVINSGTIVGTGAWKGVHLLLGGGVDNDGGLITGAHFGVDITGGAGAVTNSGTIAATYGGSGAGVVLRGGGYVVNDGGLITGYYGVLLSNGGVVANNAGLIQGAKVGVTGTAGTVSNSGTIAGVDTTTTGILLTGGSVSNAGVIAGGIQINGAAGTVDNTGMIVGGFAGVFLTSGGSVANNGGEITANGYGVYASNSTPGTVTNSGTITATGIGVQLRGGWYIANNGGSITADFGVRLYGGGTVTNNAGLIQGDTIGVRIKGSAGTVSNSGMITGGSKAIELGAGRVDNNAGSITSLHYGVKIYDVGTVTNSGAITATLGIGVRILAGNVLINSGMITGYDFGVFTGLGTVTNYGTITATSTNVGSVPAGILFSGTVINFGTIAGAYAGNATGILGGGLIVNTGGLIKGSQGINLKFGGTVINSGTIVGGGSSGIAIVFGGTSVSMLALQPGYVISGRIRGSTSVQAVDILELDGAAAAPLTVNYNGLELGYFDRVLFGAGNYNTLKVSNNASILPITISGFDATSEIIDLTGIGSDGQVTNHDTANYRLTVGGSLGSVTLQLDATDGTAFSTAPDGTGGTNLIACFLRGTRIRTAAGELPVEQLTIGDHVMTSSGEEKPIRWIGRRAYDRRFVAGNRRVLPVCVRAGALGERTPTRDLWVSPEHSLLIDGVLVQAMHLVNGASITHPVECDQVEYFHIELEAHDVIFAEGAAVETFIDCDNRFMFQNAADYIRLYPDDERPHWQFCAPRPDRDSAEVTAIRTALLALAEARGRANRDPDLHLIVDGCPLQPYSVADGAYRFVVPAGARGITIRSRTAIPAETEPNCADLRPLGVPLRRLMLRGDGMNLEITSDCPALHDGFHTNEGSHRWTNGRGKLPPELLACFEADVAIEVWIGITDLHYPIDAPTVDLRQERPNTPPIRGARIAAGLAYSAAAASGAASGSIPRARL